MTSLKLILFASLLTTFTSPAWAGTTASSNPNPQRESAKALGGEVKPSITLFSENSETSSKPPDLDLQMSGKRPLEATANPDIWESELLDDQRRTDPGFFWITAD